MDDLPPFPQAFERLSLEDQVDSPRITDIEKERVGGHPLNPVSRLEEELKGGIPVLRNSYPGQFHSLYDEAECFSG